jgi:hypothetical protein
VVILTSSVEVELTRQSNAVLNANEYQVVPTRIYNTAANSEGNSVTINFAFPLSKK